MSVARTIATVRAHLAHGKTPAYAAVLSAAIRAARSDRTAVALRRVIEEDGTDRLFRSLDGPVPVAA